MSSLFGTRYLKLIPPPGLRYQLNLHLKAKGSQAIICRGSHMCECGKKKKKDDISKQFKMLISSRHGPVANCTLRSDTEALFALVQMCLIATGTRLQTPLNHTSIHPANHLWKTTPWIWHTFKSWKCAAQASLRIHRSIRKKQDTFTSLNWTTVYK